MRTDDTLETFVPLVFKRRGIRRLADTGAVAHDMRIIEAVARAFHWQQLRDSGEFTSGTAIARAEELHHSAVNELLRLTLLEPAIIQAILTGQQPRCMSLLWFQRNPLPTDWIGQRKVVAGFDA